MTTLTITLPAEVYEHLRVVAVQRGQPVEEVAQVWLAEHSTQARNDIPPPTSPGERERAIDALHKAGLLSELSSEEKVRARRSTLSLEAARAILDRAGGKPLSEIILDMRGPKE